MQGLEQPELLFESPMDAHLLAKCCSPPALYSCILSPLPSIVQEVELVSPQRVQAVVEVQYTKLEDADLSCGLKTRKLKPKML